jgi:peptidyl-prolyl cis-trans isomerase C
MKYAIIPTCLVLALAAGCGNKTAGNASKDGGDVAVVNGKGISRSTFDFYVQGVTGKPAAEANAEQKAQLLDNLIRGELVAADAEKTGLTKQAETQAILELTRLNVLQQQVSQGFLKDHKATDEDLKKEYDTQVASMPKTEYHAKHILVATEPFAKKLIEQLDKGAKFEDLAKKESMDPSKDSGGDLGWFTPDRMVPPFSQAVAGLAKGSYTKAPVQTQYGWHVIRLEETREVAPPPFDSVKDRLVQIVDGKKFKTYADELAKSAKIEKKL